jgi:hypothetical protein
VNIVVLLINTIKDELSVTFVSLGIIVYPTIYLVDLLTHIGPPCSLSESNLCGTYVTNPRQYPSSDCRVKLSSALSCCNK